MAEVTKSTGGEQTGSGGSGSVTSIDVSGGTTGLTTSGGPITSSGTITLAGTLAIANGGTNSSLTATSGSLLVGNGTSWIPTSKITLNDANSSIILKAASGTNTDLIFTNNNTTNNVASGTFYPSTGTNVGCYFQVCPKGTGLSGVGTQFSFGITDYIADPTNYSLMIQRTGSSGIQWMSLKGGTGSYYPFFFNVDGTFTPSTSAFYIGTNKNVGINTNTPQSKLDVEGNVAIGATYSGTTAAPTNGLIVEGLVGMGVSSPSAALHILKTTEQLRVAYDASNYFSTTVSSSGVVTLDAVGSSSSFVFSDSTSTPNLIASNKGIDTTAGDSATINAMAGRFRKDATGETFTLTNSFITANSIILLTWATTGITGGTKTVVVAGSGSATITFEDPTTGIATAPSANTDINFIVIN